MEFKLADPRDNTQIKPELLENHLLKTGGKVVTRFPPEPNGFLHLGHTKAMFINFMFAKNNNGICYLRFDDTNPLNEKKEYIESILEDVEWLGYTPHQITHTSDYFDELIKYAFILIEKDKAYVCELDDITMKKNRYMSIESPFRNRPNDESYKLFESMIRGEYKPGSICLRLKCDMKSPNPNMRDLVAYRIVFDSIDKCPEFKQGKKYVVFPTYDYSHPIVDSLENITHSLCSMEFQTRNELYRWMTKTLEIYGCPQIEFSKLNVSNTILSKRKLNEIVEIKIVDGWSDPRMPTIRGLRNKGYTPDAIRNFCSKMGMSIGTSAGLVNYSVLEECLRQDLEDKAPRILAVIDPLKLTIVNFDEPLVVTALDFPARGDASTKRHITVNNAVFIEKDDFMMNAPKKYHRLTPNQIVRLKYLGLVKYVDVKVDIDDNIIEVLVELLPKAYIPEKKVRGTINWVSEIDHMNVIVRKCDHLFPKILDVSIPENEIKNNKDWKEQLNLKSSEFLNVMTDSSLMNAKPFEKYQFERIGYFSVDPNMYDGKLMLNKTVALKEDKEK